MAEVAVVVAQTSLEKVSEFSLQRQTLDEEIPRMPGSQQCMMATTEVLPRPAPRVRRLCRDPSEPKSARAPMQHWKVPHLLTATYCRPLQVSRRTY